MRVAFLLQDLQLSGGVGVVVEHARQLTRRHGFDVTLALTRAQTRPDWTFEGLDTLHVLPLEEARNAQYDVVVATWWRTAHELFEFDARRYAYFVQSLEDRFYRPEERGHAEAAATLRFPVHFVTEARWIAETLDELRPDVPCYYVRNGVSKETFPPLERVEPRLDGPLRILVEGSRVWWHKGVDEALAAAGAMNEQRHVTLVTHDGGPIRATADADRVVGPLPQAELAALYAETDVVLKLSRVEGMFGPPLEGFHAGATCVVTPVTGHDEYVVHGWNGLVCDWDDTRGTARQLDLLARDRRLLHFLRSNALQTARAWPSWEQSSSFMALALGRIAGSEAASLSEDDMRGIMRAAAAADRSEREGLVEHLDLVRGRKAYRLAATISRIQELPAYVARPFRRAARRLGRALRRR